MSNRSPVKWTILQSVFGSSSSIHYCGWGQVGYRINYIGKSCSAVGQLVDQSDRRSSVWPHLPWTVCTLVPGPIIRYVCLSDGGMGKILDAVRGDMQLCIGWRCNDGLTDKQVWELLVCNGNLKTIPPLGPRFTAKKHARRSQLSDCGIYCYHHEANLMCWTFLACGIQHFLRTTVLWVEMW